jgi:hypothetical protein
VKYTFVFSNDNGNVNLYGVAIYNNQKAIINRQVQFDYKRKQNNYFIISKHITKFSHDSLDGSFVADHYPKFFKMAENGLYLKVVTDNFLISFGEDPVFYCKAQY